MNRFVEVIVFVPIRRTFRKEHVDPPPPDALAAPDEEQDSGLQTFHYQLPIQLEDQIRPGHLIWVPFGRQTLQGVVVQVTDAAPLATKAVLRLARPQPVLTPGQLQLAHWIAHTYVAPLSEGIKLFLPPGLLQKRQEDRGVRARREERITLQVDRAQALQQLRTLGRESQQVRVLTTLLQDPERTYTEADLQTLCGLKSPSAIRTLVQKGAVANTDHILALALSPEAGETLLLTLRGADRYLPLLNALLTAPKPIWKSDLYQLVDTELSALRTLHKAGIITLSEEVRYRDPMADRGYAPTFPPPLTDQQAGVWQRIATWLQHAQPPTSNGGRFLLHGVTGSGKTEIYLRTIAHILEQGKQAIVLVPEIALTPQTVARFAGRFPGRVSVIHSQLSQGERYDVWRRILEGGVDIVVGPRSALFAPLPNLGLIILDEEHEGSYKQDAEVWGSFKVFYDARQVARRLAQESGSVLILGSATPSLESYYEAMQGELTLLELPRRVLGHGGVLAPGPDGTPQVTAYAELPPVEVVDMRQELRAGNRSIFSRSLLSELHATLDAGEQAILFLNRRGTSTFVMCRDCGHVTACTRCETPLTYHERVNELVCHRCNRRYPIPEICPECSSRRIKYFGSGTQRVEDLVRELVPRARLLRWDADTTGRKGSHEAIMERFVRHEADVLVGTQMIAKGLDLPLVTLVGVISADVGLYLPDFRSAERTFQLLTQVAGRAGRSQRGGRVVIQCYTPQHYAVQAAAQHDYQAFYDREMAFRTEHHYPPVRRLAKLVYWDKKLEKAQQASAEMVRVLQHQLTEMGISGDWVDVLGPAPAFFARYRGYYRWQVLLRAPDPAGVLRRIPIPFGWRVDIDPISLL